MKLATIIAALVVILSITPAGASNTGLCLETNSMRNMLAAKFKETPMALGVLRSRKGIMELYSSKSGTWTIVISLTVGMSCVLASGYGFEKLEQQLPSSPS